MFESVNAYFTQFFDFRLRTANGWTAYWSPAAVVVLITAGNCIVIWLDLPAADAPYQSAYIVAALVLANRMCIRAGLLTVALSAPAFNYIIGGNPFITAANRLHGIEHVGLHFPTGWEVAAWVFAAIGCLLIAPRRVRNPEPRIFDRGSNLPFTSDRPDGTNGPDDLSLHGNGARYWDVDPTFDWGKDCEIGEAYSRMLRERAAHGEARPMMCWIVRDMIMAHRYTGVECGFIQGMVRTDPRPTPESRRQ